MDLKNPTRTEALLANIAGYTGVPVPDMKNATRSERLLKEILDNGGGGGGGVTKEYVDNAIADAVTAIDEDISDITDAVENKVDKISGKGLSTNDYTDADKALVADSPITVTATTSPISTANGKPRAITIYGKSEVVDGSIKSAGDSGSIDVQSYTGTNLFGGLDFAQKLNIVSNVSVINTTDKTVTFQRYGNITRIVYNNFKPNTQYTFIMSYSNTTNNNSLRIKYNTGLDDVFNFTASNTKSTIVLTTDLTRNVKQLYLEYYEAGLTTLYYDECGIFEGVKTESDFEPYNGTMATFTTGTPLYGVSADIRDVMTWDGSAGTVTKVSNKIRLANLTWIYDDVRQAFYTNDLTNMIKPAINFNSKPNLLIDGYTVVTPNQVLTAAGDMRISAYNYGQNDTLILRNLAYTTLADFVASLGDAELIYELATPTTEPLTQTENTSIAGLKTYSPQTAITINDNPDFKIKAYANTANGQAISDMQPTRSPLLTLSASGWTNNAQTVTYTHDIGKRNTIDVEPANIKAWTAAGILATAETTSTITFECDTTPTSDLLFRVTSMEVR